MAVALSPAQLKKPYTPKHEYYNVFEDRGEKFLDKIEKGESFELLDGSQLSILPDSIGIDFLKNKKYNKLGNGRAVFQTTKGLLTLSQFKKTPEFGSNGGIGAGSKNTAIQESTQAVFNALAYNIKDGLINEIDVTYEAISSSYQFCETTTELKDIYNFAKNPTWLQSFLTSSNIIYSHVTDNSFEHHRDSELIGKIYEAYKKCGLKYRSDKWNPSDIWLVNPSIINTEFSESIYYLNDQLESMFLHNELVGVSLKKVGKEPKIEIKNLDKTKNTKYFYEGHVSTNKSKDITLQYNDGRICFRTFNFASGWSGEILGKNASHGKIGWGAINEVLKKYKINPIKKPQMIKEGFENHEYLMRGSLLFLFRKYINDISMEDFDIFIEEKNIDWKVSKLMGLQLLTRIENSSPIIKNKIITDILLYASSELDESSVYLKLS